MEPRSQSLPLSNPADSASPARPGDNDQGAIVPAPTTDDSPTIISKNQLIAEQLKPGAPRESLGNSLRGRRLAHFELIEPIGVGGMAAVIRARDTQLDRFVALKILPPEMAADEENVQRFHQEARAAAKLDHENIARVFYCGEDQRLHFIAFEFVEGEDLRTILNRRRRLSVAEAVRYVLQIATGLEHAASRGVVHRDIKPSNIIITPSGKAKLVDMGLARSLEPQTDQLTQSGMTLGTFDYISPEQALEPRDADARSDLYSLGCTFYHMLTGRPPVPEGTAGKKLHHHQHVAPVDPRQLNPEVPDEVAAIMGKMMAKEPRERYQRPIFLVQHLMHIAQKVGAAADLPEGGIIVETPLPAEPRLRPLLVASLAALGLAALIFLITIVSQPESTGPLPRPGKGGDKDKRLAAKDSSPLPRPPLPIGAPIVVRNEADLQKTLDDAHGDTEAFVDGQIDLNELGLIYHGGAGDRLRIESRDVAEPATIRFRHQPRGDGIRPAGGLVIEGGTVVIENVRFEIESPSTPDHPLATITVRGGGRLELRHCTFVQTKVPQRSFLKAKKVVPLASILAENSDGSRPRVTVEQCYFYGAGYGGQAAVALNGPVDLKMADCAFKPHAYLFHVRGAVKDEPSSVQLQRCSAFVYNGPAFRVDDEARLSLNVSHCIFSGPGTLAPPLREEEPPHFIFQTRTKTPLVQYEGLENCFHNLWGMSYMMGEEGTRIVNSLDEFHLLGGGKGDRGSRLISNGPSIWASAAPLKEEEDRPEDAFQLRADLEEVRTADLKRPLGVERCVWDRKMDLPPFVPRDVAAAAKLKPNEKLVDPDAEARLPGVYGSLFAAVADAKSGDVILIKQSRKAAESEVQPIPLDRRTVELTFKPYPGHHVTLAIDSTPEPDAYFFRIYEGRLHFENIDFVLEPDQVNCAAQSVVMMGGNASCTFKDCIITMKPGDRVKLGKRVPLQVVTLLDPDDAKGAMPLAARGIPEIVLQDSFVRGEGDLLHPRATRPFDLTLDNSVLCLAGCLVGTQATLKDIPLDAAATLRMTKVSAFSTDALLALRWVKNAKGFVPLRVEKASGCVFVALADKPLIYVESPENEEGMRNIVEWKGGINGYGPFNRFLENFRPEDPVANVRMEQPGWKTHSGEADSRFPTNAFYLPTATQSALWTATPDQLRYEDLSDLGAVLEADLLARLPGRKSKSAAGAAP